MSKEEQIKRSCKDVQFELAARPVHVISNFHGCTYGENNHKPDDQSLFHSWSAWMSWPDGVKDARLTKYSWGKPSNRPAQ